MTETRCINCGFFRALPVAKLELHKKELLKQWIPQIEVLDTHSICKECIIQLDMSEEGAARSLGHPNICINCGYSTAKHTRKNHSKKRVRVLNPKHKLYDYVMGLARKDLPDSLKGVNFFEICNKCFLRLTYVNRAAKPEVCLLPKDSSDMPAETTEVDESQTSQTADSTNNQQQIQLNEYKRVKARSGKCVVDTDCDGELRSVPLRLRQTTIVRNALYVPHGIKLCTKHAKLPPPSNVSVDNSFSGEEIADMLFLLKCVPPLEANGVIDQHMCREWLGVQLSEFRDTVRKCRRDLQEPAGSAKDTRLAVAAYYLKHQQRQRNCDTVIASLLECDPKQVQTLAKLVEECLKNPQNGTELTVENDNSDKEIDAFEVEDDPVAV